MNALGRLLLDLYLSHVCLERHLESVLQGAGAKPSTQALVAVSHSFFLIVYVEHVALVHLAPLDGHVQWLSCRAVFLAPWSALCCSLGAYATEIPVLLIFDIPFLPTRVAHAVLERLAHRVRRATFLSSFAEKCHII